MSIMVQSSDDKVIFVIKHYIILKTNKLIQIIFCDQTTSSESKSSYDTFEYIASLSSSQSKFSTALEKPKRCSILSIDI